MNKLITLKTDNERARIVLSMLPGQPDNQIVKDGKIPLTLYRSIPGNK